MEAVESSEDNCMQCSDRIFLKGDVVWYANGLAIVKFSGKPKFNPDVHMLGLDLGNAAGDTNGTIDGVTYFEAEENQGKFIESSKIKKKIHAEQLLHKLAETDRSHRQKVDELEKSIAQLQQKNLSLRKQLEKKDHEVLNLKLKMARYQYELEQLRAKHEEELQKVGSQDSTIKKVEVDEEQAVMDVLADILEADPAHSEGGKTLESDEDLEKKRPEVKSISVNAVPIISGDTTDLLISPKKTDSGFVSPRPDMISGNPLFSPRPGKQGKPNDASPRPDISQAHPLFSPRPG